MRHLLPLLALCGVLLTSGCGDTPSGSPAPSGTVLDAPQVMWTIRREEGIDTYCQSVEDANYTLVSVSFAQEVYLRTRGYGLEFQDAIADCDDFAHLARHFALEIAREKGWAVPPAFGVAYRRAVDDPFAKDGRHSLNFFVDPYRKVWFFEPQTGKAWKPSTAEKEAVYFYLLS